MVGNGEWVLTQNIPSIGSKKQMVAGYGATSIGGLRSRNAYPSSMSIGTKRMLTPVGPIDVCQRKRSGRWQQVPNHRQMDWSCQTTSDDFPGVTIPQL